MNYKNKSTCTCIVSFQAVEKMTKVTMRCWIKGHSVLSGMLVQLASFSNVLLIQQLLLNIFRFMFQ